MKRSIVCFALAALLMCLAPAAYAAGNESAHVNYITDVFNEETGLPTGEANAILQAQNGYLWIGSYGGLIRYDGSTFVDFPSFPLLHSGILCMLFSSFLRCFWQSG